MRGLYISCYPAPEALRWLFWLVIIYRPNLPEVNSTRFPPPFLDVTAAAFAFTGKTESNMKNKLCNKSMNLKNVPVHRRSSSVVPLDYKR